MNSKVLSYLFFIAAVVVVALFVLNVIPESVMLAAIGLFGFSGIASLRTFINSSGYKTYISCAIGIVGVVAFSFGVVTAEQLELWLALFGFISGATTTHAVSKAA